MKKLLLFLGIVAALSFKSAPFITYHKDAKLFNPRSGNPVDFKLKDINGKIVSLSDFRGKFVVIDFWASWCIPCKEEMPAAEKLINDLSGNDKVVFLFISFDEDADAWKRAAKKYVDNGPQLIVGDKNEDLKAMFNMDAIPHFAWVNSKGVIVKMDAPRPSEFGTKATLKAYLMTDN